MSLDLDTNRAALTERDVAEPLLLRRPLFDGALLRIDKVVAHAGSNRPTPERELREHGIVLPYCGVFATHSDRRHAVVASPSHAVLLSARTPYRYSYPGASGDQCLVLLWSDEALERVAPASIRRGRFDMPGPAAAPVLAPATLLARERLRHRLADPAADRLAVEEEAIGMLAAVLRCVQRDPVDRSVLKGAASARNQSRIERIKELIATAPARRWTLEGLAAVAAVTPCHLAHLFKLRVGVSVYEYVLRARLDGALLRVLDSPADLTSIALDAGFSSHSHFTAQFRARYGTTPLALRREGSSLWPAQVRRIATAGRKTAS